MLALAAPVPMMAASWGGGTTIASAATINSGQRVFGNTASEPTTSFASIHGQWWLFRAKSGDSVQISWENSDPAERFQVALFTAGTSDATVDFSREIQPATYNVQAHSGGLSFAAPANGLYPFIIGSTSGDPGPYSLVVQIRHKALVFLPRLSSVSLGGRITATVRDPGGEPISDAGLQLRLLGTWKDASHLPQSSHVLATTSPKNGAGTFSFKLPRKLAGTVIRLRIVGGGPDWQDVASATRTVHVARS